MKNESKENSKYVKYENEMLNFQKKFLTTTQGYYVNVILKEDDDHIKYSLGSFDVPIAQAPLITIVYDPLGRLTSKDYSGYYYTKSSKELYKMVSFILDNPSSWIMYPEYSTDYDDEDNDLEYYK